MKKVRYIKSMLFYPNLTPGKVYDVIEFIPGNRIVGVNSSDLVILLDDNGVASPFYIHITPGLNVFEDYTTIVHRNKVIDSILN